MAKYGQYNIKIMAKYGQYNIPDSDIMVNFGTGQPNNLNLPIDYFQLVCNKMSQDKFGRITNDHNQLLQYGAIDGYPDIKEKLALWLTKKYYENLSINENYKTTVLPFEIFMTNGNTGALHMIITKYTKPNDYIIVEDPSYFLAINIFKEYGLKIEGITMENDGINLEDLENKIIELNAINKQNKLFYYMIPTHHNPTGITTSHNKRKKLAELCYKYDNLYIIADEVYHFLTFTDYYDFYPMGDYNYKILSLGSFSKILAPAFRVGWIYCKDSLLLNDLKQSAVLDSSGGMNPIGFKIIEYLLEKDIESIINNHLLYLKNNCNAMISFLNNNNISFIKPNGGYFLWLNLDIKNMDNFIKICENNKIKFHAGQKFSVNNNYRNYIRLSFSYYPINDLIIGLERLMNSIKQYNKINIMLNGSSGRLGRLIKNEILSNNDFNYISDITRNLDKKDFINIPNNTVIMDVSSNDGLNILLTFLLENKIYIPIVTGTTGLSDITIDLLNEYSNFTQVAHITNFSEGIPIFRQFAKISNVLNKDWIFKMTDIHHIHKKDAPSGTAKTIKSEINREFNIETIRTGEVIGTHILELTNGSETLKIIHDVSERNAFAKGSLNYVKWILKQENGIYNKMNN